MGGSDYMNIVLPVDLNTLDDSLKDINSNDIPEHVLAAFWGIKTQIGSHALGIAYFPKNGWYIVDSVGKVFVFLNK